MCPYFIVFLGTFQLCLKLFHWEELPPGLCVSGYQRGLKIPSYLWRIHKMPVLTNIIESKPKCTGPGTSGEGWTDSEVWNLLSHLSDEIIENILKGFFNLCQIPRWKVDSLLVDSLMWNLTSSTCPLPPAKSESPCSTPGSQVGGEALAVWPTARCLAMTAQLDSTLLLSSPGKWFRDERTPLSPLTQGCRVCSCT